MKSFSTAIALAFAIAMPCAKLSAQVWGGTSTSGAYTTSTNSTYRAGKVGIGYTSANPTLNYQLQVFDPTTNIGTRTLFGSSGSIIGNYGSADGVYQFHGVGTTANAYMSLFGGVNGTNNVGLTLAATTGFGVSLSYNSSGTTAQQPFIIYGNAIERMRILTDAGTKLLLGSSGSIVGSFATNDGVIQQHAAGAACISMLGAKSGSNYSAITLYNNASGAQLAVNTSGLTAIPFTINNNGNEAIRVWPSGAVGIGTGTNALNNTKLAVEGLIACRELKVVALATPWPDYVFGKEYQRLSFDELQSYIDQNKHLPHISSASEVESVNGFNVGETQMSMLRSVEELYLYMLDLKKENDKLRSEIDALKKSQH